MVSTSSERWTRFSCQRRGKGFGDNFLIDLEASCYCIEFVFGTIYVAFSDRIGSLAFLYHNSGIPFQGFGFSFSRTTHDGFACAVGSCDTSLTVGV